jgi:GTP-sensing pleiotropic transcriptional regulator CodY
MLLSNTHTIAQILSINTIHINNVTFKDVCTDTRKRMDGALFIKESKGIYFGLGMAQSKISTSYDETSEYKKNNWKALTRYLIVSLIFPSRPTP